jgi:ribulose-bisphosphate carboxylase small chain
MWNLPMFDLAPEQADVAMREIASCREQFPNHYVKVIAYDSSYGRQTTALSFIVSRPPDEPGFRLERTDRHDRSIEYRLHSYATDVPSGRRYGGGADREAGVGS